MKKIGDQGEILAIRYLQKHHYHICDTNFKFGRFGEIDIIAQKQGRYYFLEVKYRKNTLYGIPEESIIPQKLRKCLKTMQYFCAKNNISHENIQFDVLAITRHENFHRVRHYKNIEI